ncbi:helix-turn-helix domain-containing protein [Hymenobacter aerophilus]|uniref:helix-turn-helix domain-containing protein n=1 Tax=Hymenobacter aerophilus TaxID=119644 RepID=UPI00037C980A|nr:helix-turn-helix domain-containing protein [Hymenobacter aerophilus]
MSRRRDTLVLSLEQRHLLHEYLACPGGGADSRAEVLRCWDAGLTGAETARQLELPEYRVYALRRAFRRQGLVAYLGGASPGGAPTKLTPAVIGELARLTARPGGRRWSLQRLAGHLVGRGIARSISTVTVAKALRQLKSEAS